MLTGGIGCNANFLLLNRRQTHHLLALEFVHSVLGEVTEDGVERLGEHVVVAKLPCSALRLSQAKNLLQVILDNHGRGVVDLRHHGSGVTHFLNKL